MRALTGRGKVCRLGQNHDPVVILRQAWLTCAAGGASSVRLVVLTAAETTSPPPPLLLLSGRRAEGNLGVISSVSGPQLGLGGSWWMVAGLQTRLKFLGLKRKK